MDERMESARCILCDCDNADVLLTGRHGGQIVRCRNDGFVFMSPRPRASHVRTFHTSFVRENNLELFDGHRRRILQREARIIKQARPSGYLLDVGCATGTFFENFQDGNWKLFGVDTSSLGVEIVRTKYNCEAFCGTLREARFPDEYFDVITILDTLYYNPDPKAELAEARRVLRHDGVLAVELPGFTYSLIREKGPLCWIVDRRWTRGLADSHHLFYFSPASTRLLLEQAGFAVVKMVPEQASLGRRGALAALNETHFALARLLFRLTAGTMSIAGKELYLARKAGCAPTRLRPENAWKDFDESGCVR